MPYCKTSGKKSALEIETHIDLEVSDKRRSEARKILEENGVDLSKKTVALGVGSTNSRAKRWQTGSYAKLNDLLQNDLQANVLLVGAKDEIEISNEVFAKSESQTESVCSKTNISGTKRFLRNIIVVEYYSTFCLFLA